MASVTTSIGRYGFLTGVSTKTDLTSRLMCSASTGRIQTPDGPHSTLFATSTGACPGGWSCNGNRKNVCCAPTAMLTTVSCTGPNMALELENKPAPQPRNNPIASAVCVAKPVDVG